MIDLNSLILLFFSCLQLVVRGAITVFDLQYQFTNISFNYNMSSIYEIYCYTYGIFTRYNPLIDIQQLGEIGILDSNCYNIHHTIDKVQSTINFLYYDCIDYKNKQIEKSYIFIGDEGDIYKHSYQLNIYEYESYWYFLGIIVNLEKQKFEISLLQNNKVLHSQEYNLKQTNYGTDLYLIFGGSLQINIGQPLFNAQINKLSYFPGNEYYISLSSYVITTKLCQISEFQINQQVSPFTCKCKFNKVTNIPDQFIQELNQQYFISENLNCDLFHFKTWIRIKERNYYIKEIYYQLIKISAHFLNPKLLDDNLSAFQLYYKLTDSINQIIITTYSYTFPIVNIDQLDTPFLIKKTFDIDLNIQLWHFIKVKKSKNSILVQIFFQEGRNVKEYSFESIVNHFNQIRFKVSSGNLLQTFNYLTIQLINMVFNNCGTESNSEPCHQSCQECDGPTKSDCLSCDPSTNRIYNVKQKACVCAYGKIDLDGECKDYSFYSLNISQGNKKELICSYGYFESDDQCWKCPSKIREHLITCIECITNPKTWINDPYCQYNFVTDNNERPFTKQDDGMEEYFFDGVDIKLTENQEQHTDIYSDYLLTFNHFQNFCQNCLIDLIKESCFIFQHCEQCEIHQSRPICTKCVMNFQLFDGACNILKLIQTSRSIICETPYYQTYYNECIKCSIVNCLYCFDYIKDDVTKNTIYYTMSKNGINQIYANDLQVLVGCAQCLQGYLYDFTIGQCIYQQPQIQNCLRSFVNQQGKELCILTSIDDFTVAPQIINCENHIIHCEQCFQNFQTILKCLICEIGYVASQKTGLCQIITKSDSSKYIGLFYDNNIWRYVVQSFSMQFTQINYSYQPANQQGIYDIECSDGYSLYKGKCTKYCDQNCQQCLKQDIQVGFTCALCPLNNYQELNRVQENGKCIICPSLCLVCQIRSNDSIMSINPYYTINGTNSQYTTQCIKSISNSDVQIDPYLQIAQYIYDPSQIAIQYSVIWSCNFQYSGNNALEFFEENFDFSYFNEIGLQQFILTIQFDQPCSVNYENITNTIQTKVFSIQLIKLILKGDLSLLIFYKIKNFNFIELSNLLVNIENNLTFEFQNNGKAIDFNISNSSFFSNKLKSIKFQIPMNVYQICNIHNVSIFNANIDNQIIFQINSTTYHENILIDFFFLMDCIMKNTVLFNFKTTSKNIVIENVVIDRCELYNFTLLNTQQTTETKISIRSIIIKNSIFTNSSFLQSSDNNQLFIYSFQMIENQILNSQLIKFCKDLFSFNFVLRQNLFQESILFEKQFSINYQSEIKIDEIDLETNIFQKFSVLIIDQNKITPSKIELTNLIFKDNSNPQKEIQEYLFKFSCSNILIQNVSIINTFNHRYFYLFNISQINLLNVSVQNQLQQYRIPLHQDCAINNYQHLTLLTVKGFQHLYLGLIKFVNQITIDQSFIEILSNDSSLNQIPETITLQNINCTGNILMKINQGNIFSIISIYSDKAQQIHFDNIFYQENSYIQYNVDPTFTSASLLFINSINSSIILQNIQCFENSLTNSSNSFITISSSEIKIVQIKVFYQNYLRVELWNRYYEIQLQNNLNQIEVNYMIEEVLSIKNKGGVMQLISDKFILENGQFQYTIAKSSSIMDIITKGSGIVILNNCSIAYSQNNLLSNSEYEGSISINSQNSYLSFILKDFNFTNVYNKLAPAIITIQPSEVSNNILIRNVQVSNCFSLINLFLALSFPYENADNNQITIENILIYQSQQESLNFNRQLSILEPIILSQLTQDNAIFNIKGCKLQISNLKFQGFALSGILNLINCKKIYLVNILLDQITLFYNLNLLHIEQVVQVQSHTYISNLTVDQIKIFNTTNQKLSPYVYPNFFIKNTKCSTLKPVQLPINEQQSETKTNNFEQIQLYSAQNGSILYLRCSNNQTNVRLQSILLQYNDCKTCRNGLIFFQLVDFLKIKIEELSCIGNIVQKFGCITASSEKKLQGKLNIRNSLFVNNSGSQGVAVSSINVKIFLFNIKIFHNTATLLGGGLYLDLNNNEFSINSTHILYNKAREGGGIYLNGESILSEINFEKSLFNFNYAELTTNNLQELPSHLDLSINHQIMPSHYAYDQIQQKSLKLLPYRIIQQGKILMTNKLMIPSNQEIAKYELYNPQQQKFTSYINELSIQFKNRFNEQLLNYINSTCQIIESIYDINKQTLLESNNITLIQFNQTTNSFDMGMLILTFDPYNQTNNQYEIEIYCKTKNQIQQLSYNLKVKSLVCQLGEFYVLNGCLTCQSKQGFYSVTYNATKCSIFDKVKFDAITSNNINLKPGYWRPHPESELVNDCYKNVESCKGGWVVGNDICKIGHIGGLCEECDKHNIRGDGYYFKDDEFTCWNCSEFSINILSLILITVWVFLSTFITLTSVEKTNQLFVLFKLTQKFAHILFKMNLNQESILLKLFLNYIWIFSVNFTFNIQFSFSFIFVNQISDTSYFLTRNLDCELSQSFEIELIYMRVLVMFTLISLQIFIIQLGVNIFSMLAKVKFRNNIFSITLIYFYIQNYAALINQLFSILATREISKIDYVQGDVSLFFESSNHQAWIYKFALPLSLLIGLILPLSLLGFLYQKRKLFDNIKLRRHIGYLFNEYSSNSSFWEWIKLWKKTIIIVILIYFETNIFFKGFLIGMCLMIYQIITSSYLPYIYPKLNRLDLNSGQLCSIAIFLAAVQYLCEQQENYVQARILQILIVLICFRFSLPYLYDIISAYYGKYKETIFTFFIIILKTFNPKSRLIWKLRDKLEQWKQKSLRIERNFKKMRYHSIQKKRKEKKEQQQVFVPTLSLNKSGELKFKLLNL